MRRRLRDVEEERAAENAELVGRRQDVKRLEQDLVDAHQVVEAGDALSPPACVRGGDGKSAFPCSK